MIGSESKGECLSPEDIGLVPLKGWGRSPPRQSFQLLFTTGKSFTVDGLREKLREFFRQEVRPELRAVAALNNVELITALLSCNRQLALVGLQLRIINGVVSLLTTEVHNRALAAYLSEQTRASANSGLTTATLEVLTCIAFKQPISQTEIDHLFDADKRGLVVTLRDLKLVEEFAGTDGRLRFATTQPFCSASVWQVCRNWQPLPSWLVHRPHNL